MALFMQCWQASMESTDTCSKESSLTSWIPYCCQIFKQRQLGSKSESPCNPSERRLCLPKPFYYFQTIVLLYLLHWSR